MIRTFMLTPIGYAAALMLGIFGLCLLLELLNRGERNE